MPILNEYSFTRYLSAKRSVDDRALNRYAWECLRDALHKQDSILPLRILEIGSGIGTMVERIMEWHLTERFIEYTAIDAIEENITVAQQRLSTIPADHLQLELEAINLFDFIDRVEGQRDWDVVIAHAFLDLIDLSVWLPRIIGLVKSGGLFYFTINFDGLTALEPAIDAAYDDLIIRLYHETMDQRVIDGKRSGDSRTGRHLFERLQQGGVDVLAAGSSDWVVHPSTEGYVADEAYFLHFIIHTMEGALRRHPQLDSSRFAGWIAERHAQIERGELVYIAHQIDILGQRQSLCL